MRTVFVFLVFVLILGAFASDACARILRVPNQHQTIQAAVDASQMQDTILVAQGEYQENVSIIGRNLVLASQFIFTDDEEDIRGTIINGGANGASTVAIRQFSEVVLTGFTLTNGQTDFGGGIYCRESNVVFSHLEVHNCVTERNGAGIYCTQRTNAEIHDVYVHDNDAGYVGSGFGCYGGSVIDMYNSLFIDNYSDHVGGGLHCHGAELNIRNITVANNVALHSGGAVYVTSEGQVNATDVVFWNNEPHEVYVMSGFDATRFSVWFSDIMNGRNGVVSIDPNLFEWGVGNIDADPEFVDAENGDYRLLEDSPCIDAGSPENPPDPDGTRSDLGKWYFHQEEGGSIVLNVPDDFDSIQEAVDESADGDLVFVQPGEYFENLDFGGKEITVASRYYTTHSEMLIDETVIDGGGEGSVVVFEDEGPGAMLIGFTLTNGDSENGGGVFMQNSRAALTDLKIENCTAGNIGGGVYVQSAANQGPVLKNLKVRNNASDEYGGGIGLMQRENQDEDITRLENVAVHGNSAGAGGGGMYVSSGASFDGVEIFDNESEDFGGGVFCIHAGVEMHRTLIAGNSGPGTGPALRLWGSDVRLNRATIAGNQGDNNPAVFVAQGSNIDLINSIMYSNAPSGFEFAGEPNAISAGYCDIMNGRNAMRARQEDDLAWGEGNIDVDPVFADRQNGDYRLMAGSPCIDAGDPDHQLDPDGTPVDMGAYFHEQEFNFARLFAVPDDYETIQEAIDVASDGDTILVSPGRYRENLQFLGQNIIVASLFLVTRNPEYITSTIIDGGGEDVVVKITRGEWERTELCGFTITNGSGREGGGIFIYNSWPSIAHCLIMGNHAEDGGGGIFCYGAGPDLNNCTIVDNGAESGAGGLHLKNLAGPDALNTIIWGNENDQVVFYPELEPNNLWAYYCDIQGGEQGVVNGWNGAVDFDDNCIDEEPGFTDFDEGDFSLTENSPCIDAGDPETRPDYDGSRADLGALAFDHGGEDVELNIPLRPGWSLISTPIPPPVNTLEWIFGGVLANENLVLVKDWEGHFYYPDENYNRIDFWDFRCGYWVKVRGPDEVNFAGRPVAVDTPIPVERGWSIVSYFPATPQEPQVAFLNIEDDVELAKDQLGRFYLPEYDFSNMGLLRWGRGYQIKVAGDVDLVWNEPDERFRDAREYAFELPAPVHFDQKDPTGRNMSLVILSEDASEGGNYGELAAFSKSGACLGVVALKGAPPYGLAVWGDDPATPEVDGAIEGEPVDLHYWDGGKESILEPAWIEGAGKYSTDSWAAAEIELSTVPAEFALYPPYPNPFNSSVRLKYAIPQSGRVSLNLYDINGRHITTLVHRTQTAGFHQLTLQTEKWSSGVYFLKLELKGETKMVKVVCVK